jgi:hypothetical protein
MGRFIFNAFACFILSYFVLGIFGLLAGSLVTGLFPMMVLITIILMGIGKFISYVVDTEDRVRILEMELKEMKELFKKAE